MTDLLIEHRFTKPDPLYPSCERTAAELRIYPDRVRPEKITEALQVKPTIAVRKGDVRSSSEKIYPRSLWALSSESFIKSLDLRDHIDWLLAAFKFDEEVRLFLASDKNLRLTVNCVWWSKGSGGPTLWPEQMQLLATMGLECTFDIYFFEDEETV